MRINITFEDRIGIAQEILQALSRRSFNVTASEVDPPNIYVEVPELSSAGLTLLTQELQLVRGVQLVREVSILPGAQRRLYLDAILASQADPLFAIDANGAVVIANQAAIEASGMQSEALFGQQFQTLISMPDFIKLLADHHFHLPIMEVEFNHERYMLEATQLQEANGSVAGALVTLHAYSRMGERLHALQHYEAGGFERIIGTSPEIVQLKERASRMALVEAPLMITGETGTGKELLAHACHAVSRRRLQPFFALNCAALPENLAESELFGYSPGAFTGALRTGKPGLLELADGGTVFLDEVGEMSPYLQAKMLRFLNDGCFRRVGGDRELKADVRIICATHRSLEDMSAQGSFRQDLLFRLNVLNLHVPALRDRQSDILLLTEAILKSACEQVRRPHMRLTQSAKATLLKNPWTGNVRQLKNVIFRAVTLCKGLVIEVDDLELAQTENKEVSDKQGLLVSLDQAIADYEKTLLQKLYAEYPSSRKLAKRLNTSHSAISVRLRKYGIGSNAD
jgi:transcriptional regulator of aroF, aroG, tyrA and aromatic amino acid transport